ncbi:hypothetical protein JCM3775_000973 [Rhodotorula graminis]
MKFLALVAVAAALSSLASAVPMKRDDSSPTKPAYTGTLVSYTQSVPFGGNLSVAYDASAQSAVPHYAASIIGVDLGLQGPAPIVVSPNDFSPFGILKLATGLDTGGPGGWVNTSIALPSAVYKPGEYFLIVTEDQLAVYDSEQPVYRVQSYNVSVQVTAAE